MSEGSQHCFDCYDFSAESGPLSGSSVAYLGVDKEEEFSPVFGSGPHLVTPEPELAAGDMLALTTGYDSTYVYILCIYNYTYIYVCVCMFTYVCNAYGSKRKHRLATCLYLLSCTAE